MMRKLARGSFVILAATLFIIPLVTTAQENQPQPGAYCPHLTRDLKYFE